MLKKQLSYLAAIALGSSVIFSPFTSNALQKKPTKEPVKSSLMNTDSSNFEKNKLVVKTTSAITKSQLSKLNAKVTVNISELKYTVLQFKNDKALTTGFKTLKSFKNVQNINLSPTYKMFDIKNPRETKQYMHKLINSTGAQKIMGKTNIKVAVIDTGVDFKHPDLKGQILSSENTADKLKISQTQSHATHVSGIIAANKDNGIGGFGVNPQAKILGYDVFDGTGGATDYSVAQAILQATKDGAKVINMSLGSPENSELLNSAVQYAITKNVTVVASAGNSGDDEKNYPASNENVISVGSINDKSLLSDFSTYGLSTSVVAPGEDIYSTSFGKRGSTYEAMSGTSMASPVVAAVASLILSKNPNLSPAQVKYILENTAKDLGNKGFDNKYGNGLIDAFAALKFDPKKIPNLTTKQWNDEVILKDAQDIVLGESMKHSFTTSNEQKWYKVQVKKGQKLQISSVADDRTDLKMLVHFYGEGNSEKSTTNDKIEGFKEATYVEAPFDGTLAVGVQDVNGLLSINPITVDISTGDFPKDESSRENIMELDSLNKVLTNQYMNAFEDDSMDEDVLHFKATKNELVQLKLSDIPGVKTNISVYNKAAFTADITTNEATEDIINTELTSNSSSDLNENTLSFNTTAGEDYYIVLSNQFKIDDSSGVISFVNGRLIMEDLYDNEKAAPSLIPYTLSIESKLTPADEDTLEPDSIINDGTDSDFKNTAIDYFKEHGRQFNLEHTNSGYINNLQDIDGYYLTTNESGIYSVNINTKNQNTTPNIILYEMSKPTGNDEISLLNNYLITEDIYDQSRMYWSLKANTTYLIAVSANHSNLLPYDGYDIQPTLLKKNPEDAYEPNNDYDSAKQIPNSGKIEANIAALNDIDNYYYTANKTGLVSLNYQLKVLTKKDEDQLPPMIKGLYVPFIDIILDENSNKKVEENEEENKISITAFDDNYSLKATLDVIKGQNYFITVTPYLFENFNFSLKPYELILRNVPLKDEDANNIIKKNIPSKTISFNKKGKNHFERNAYFNPGQMDGDSDWFTYKAVKKGTATVTLVTSSNLDGVIEIYKDGKRIKKVDSYGDGEIEELTFNITKGQYYFKVTERFKQASGESYKFKLKLK